MSDVPFLKPVVMLVSHTKNPSATAVNSIKTRAGDDILEERNIKSEINSKLVKQKQLETSALLRKEISENRLECLAHVHYSFVIYQISESCVSQIRDLTDSCKSTMITRVDRREVKVDTMYTKGFAYVLSEELKKEDTELVTSMLEVFEDFYETLLYNGESLEQANTILPGLTSTQIMITSSGRDLYTIINKGLCLLAPKEVRDVVRGMRNILTTVSADLFPFFRKAKV